MCNEDSWAKWVSNSISHLLKTCLCDIWVLENCPFLMWKNKTLQGIKSEPIFNLNCPQTISFCGSVNWWIFMPVTEIQSIVSILVFYFWLTDTYFLPVWNKAASFMHTWTICDDGINSLIKTLCWQHEKFDEAVRVYYVHTSTPSDLL